jgi:hypothetical protein
MSKLLREVPIHCRLSRPNGVYAVVRVPGDYVNMYMIDSLLCDLSR